MTLDEVLHQAWTAHNAGSRLPLAALLAAFSPEEIGAKRRDLEAVQARCIEARVKLACLTGADIPPPADAWPPT